MPCQSEMIKNMVGQFNVGHEGHILKPSKGGIYYWHIVDFTEDMDKYKVVLAFEQVFNRYFAPYFAPLRFVGTKDINEANITLRFRKNGDADLPFPFGDKTIMYAFYPGYGYDGQIWANDGAFNFAEITNKDNIDILATLVHEAMHIYNVDHNTKDPDSILNPYIKAGQPIVFTQDDQNAINTLYGPLKEKYGTVHPETTLTRLRNLGFTEKALSRFYMKDLRRLTKDAGSDFRGRGSKAYAKNLYNVINA